MKPNEHPNLSLLLAQPKDILTSSVRRRVVETGDKVLEWNDIAIGPSSAGSRLVANPTWGPITAVRPACHLLLDLERGWRRNDCPVEVILRRGRGLWVNLGRFW